MIVTDYSTSFIWHQMIDHIGIDCDVLITLQISVLMQWHVKIHFFSKFWVLAAIVVASNICINPGYDSEFLKMENSI